LIPTIKANARAIVIASVTTILIMLIGLAPVLIDHRSSDVNVHNSSTEAALTETTVTQPGETTTSTISTSGEVTTVTGINSTGPSTTLSTLSPPTVTQQPTGTSGPTTTTRPKTIEERVTTVEQDVNGLKDQVGAITATTTTTLPPTTTTTIGPRWVPINLTVHHTGPTTASGQPWSIQCFYDRMNGPIAVDESGTVPLDSPQVIVNVRVMSNRQLMCLLIINWLDPSSQAVSDWGTVTDVIATVNGDFTYHPYLPAAWSECLVPAVGSSVYNITSNEDDRFLPGRSEGCTVDYTVVHG
jgi:hypothetical protein